MYSLCSVLAISLAVFLSEACIFTPPPPVTTTPKVTTTKKPSTTTTAKPKYECPIGGYTSTGVTCVGSDNVLKIESIPNPIDCNKKCTDYPDSKCKFWSYVATRKICFLLKSCANEKQVGVVSGEKGCVIKEESFTLFNLINEDLTDCEVKWEPTDICPPQKANGDGKIPKLGSFKFKYFDKPPSVACTKITEVICKAGAKECKTKAAIDVPIPNLYVKLTLPAGTDCEIATSPKYLLG